MPDAITDPFDQPGNELTLCDREPINIPGHIQPNGVLIVTAAGSHRISHVSENIAQCCGMTAGEILGRNLDEVLGPLAWELLQQALDDALQAVTKVVNLTLEILPDVARNVLAHQHQNRLYLEIDASPDESVAPYNLTRTLNSLQGPHDAKTGRELSDTLAVQVRQLTGFDRVMVYRFDATGCGDVVAEAKVAELEPFLHLRYPASDIPVQARRLYTLQRVRMLPDIDYVPVPMLAARTIPPLDAGALDAWQPLDMSYCILRGVSPVHLEYLRNMGVRATLSLSLLRDGVLCGMIVCHHRTPRTLPFEMRALCAMVSELASILLARTEEAEAATTRLARKQSIAQMRNRIEAANSVAEGLTLEADTLLRLLGASGAVVRKRGVARLYGETPPAAAAEALLTTLQEKYGHVIKGWDNAGEPGGIAEQYAATASGLLMIPLANNTNDIIVWFRPEMRRTVVWGGDPGKAQPDSEGHISPRTSFDAWIQQTQGCAEPWSDADFRTANDVRRMITLELLRKAENQLSLLANFDPLTGLINRRTGEAAIARWDSDPGRGPAAFLHLDLDRFIAINDILGTRAGDAILSEFATRLRDIAPPDCLVGRASSDEFALFWTNASPAEALELGQTILRAMLVPFQVGDQPHYITVSIGISHAEVGAAQDLLRQADAALIAAKRAGGGQLVQYEASLHGAVLAEMGLDQDLHNAVANQDFEVHYQPVVRAKGGRVEGFEALVRWHHKSRGWISPGLFIPRAEEIGLIGRIGGHVLRLAVRQLSVWRAEFGDLRMAINISGRQLQDCTLAGDLSALLAESGVPAKAICLEVTEGVLLQDGAVRELQQLRALGVDIAVDDFGTGYSSLAYLRTLPVTTVKIDRSFVTPIGTDSKADRLFQAIVDLAHTLNMGTVAEGVETLGQWQAMGACGCDLVQGWYIARAMDPAAAGEFLRRAEVGSQMVGQA